MTVRLIREVTSPAASGPFQGQFVLQRALRRCGPAWLTIGGEPAEGDIAWFWCWEDAQAACRWADEGRPFILGPNVLFHNSRRPCQFDHERRLCHAASCRLLFTESAWYRELIARHLGPENRAPIALWPYPVDRCQVSGVRFQGRDALTRARNRPRERVLTPDTCHLTPSLLVYAKSGFDPRLVTQLLSRFPGSAVLRYGQYRREELFEAARRLRVCAYLSDDDRGPLALAEILGCGCPAVGVPCGAPWIEHGVNGAMVEGLSLGPLEQGIALARSLDRRRIATAARERFHAATVVDQIVTAVERHVLGAM